MILRIEQGSYPLGSERAKDSELASCFISLSGRRCGVTYTPRKVGKGHWFVEVGPRTPDQVCEHLDVSSVWEHTVGARQTEEADVNIGPPIG